MDSVQHQPSQNTERGCEEGNLQLLRWEIDACGRSHSCRVCLVTPATSCTLRECAFVCLAFMWSHPLATMNFIQLEESVAQLQTSSRRDRRPRLCHCYQIFSCLESVF